MTKVYTWRVDNTDSNVVVREPVVPNEDGSNDSKGVGDMKEMTVGVGFVDGEGVVGSFISSTGIGGDVTLGVGVSGFTFSGVLGALVTLPRGLSVTR